MKIRHILYSLVVFGICLIPSAGIFLFGVSDTAHENRTLAAEPVLRREDGSFNPDFFPDAGEWFEDHFALRGELVTANALVRSEVFHVSAQDSVVRGTDGWLYYTDSLDDYQGRNLMSPRELFNLSHTLGMVQRTLEAQQVDFLFAVAPNKNTVYPGHMPWYDRGIATTRNNLEMLVPYLEKEEVHYADLKSLLTQAVETSERELYHERDSHWTGEGAFMAARKMMDKAGKFYFAESSDPYEVRTDYEGDLDRMLFPLAIKPDEEVYYTNPQIFAYVTDTQSTFDGWIQAINPSREETLLMFRDSFGNALVPFFAQEYLNSYFDRGEPYDMTKASSLAADTVMLVRAERFLEHLTQVPPLLPVQAQPLEGEVPEELLTGGQQEMSASEDGKDPVPENGSVLKEGESGSGQDDIWMFSDMMYASDTICRIEGAVDPDLVEEDSKIYVMVGENTEAVYEAFPCDMTQVLPRSGAQEEAKSRKLESGFVLNLPAELAAEGTKIRILVRSGDQYLTAGIREL